MTWRSHRATNTKPCSTGKPVFREMQMDPTPPRPAPRSAEEPLQGGGPSRRLTLFDSIGTRECELMTAVFEFYNRLLVNTSIYLTPL